MTVYFLTLFLSRHLHCKTITQHKPNKCTFYIYCGAAPQRWPWPPHSRFFHTTHNDAPHSVELLWTRDQRVAETSTWQQTTLTTDRHPCPQWVSNLRSPQSSGHWDRLYFYTNLLIFNFVGFCVFRTQGFIFRKTDVYTVLVRYVLHALVSAV